MSVWANVGLSGRMSRWRALGWKDVFLGGNHVWATNASPVANRSTQTSSGDWNRTERSGAFAGTILGKALGYPSACLP